MTAPIYEEYSYGRGERQVIITYSRFCCAQIKGRTPEPRAAHAVAVMENKAFVFGGRVGDIRNNELYYINMDTMTWSAK